MLLTVSKFALCIISSVFILLLSLTWMILLLLYCHFAIPIWFDRLCHLCLIVLWINHLLACLTGKLVHFFERWLGVQLVACNLVSKCRRATSLWFNWCLLALQARSLSKVIARCHIWSYIHPLALITVVTAHSFLEHYYIFQLLLAFVANCIRWPSVFIAASYTLQLNCLIFLAAFKKTDGFLGQVLTSLSFSTHYRLIEFDLP